VPLAAAALGTGAMFCSGGYQLILVLAPGTPFDAAGGGWFGAIIVVQVVAGLLGAMILYAVRDQLAVSGSDHGVNSLSAHL
jgi:hypothetical protein